MKKTIIITILLTSLSSCAQTIKPMSTAVQNDFKNNNYIKDTNGLLNPFVGTWQWTNGINTLTIKLIKKLNYKAFPSTEYSEDVIFGGYKYEENGLTITDCLTFDHNDYNATNSANLLMSMYCCNHDFSVMQISMTDVLKNKNIHGNFKLLYDPNSLQEIDFVPTANFKVEQLSKGYILLPGQPQPQSGESFPYNVILTKIE